jgi:transcriptional regulator with XRE-family HTH domain
LITSGQIKAARALLGYTTAKLAEKSGIGFTTLVRLESFNGVPSANVKTLDSVKRALEKSGIQFIGTPEDGPGVRLFSKR